MIRTLTTAATGLEAQQANIDRVANDLANVNTDGYKRSRTEFHDLMYETIKEPGGSLGAASQSPVGIQQGMGVKVGANHKIFEQGAARMTYHPYDIMIEGEGFFRIKMPNGEEAFTRTGAFHFDKTGKLVTAQGAYLQPEITIPKNVINTTISPGGEVKALLPNQGEVVIGQLDLWKFANKQGLNTLGSGQYQPSPASGPPENGIPGENGYGQLQQGALEGSNVNVANSMVEMIQTQRAYEMQTKVMDTANKMLEATVNLK